ncbi:MAG: lysylphosphatidylglycerol synthase transmembrane domain-containing protein [Chloroflexi bacterium]|nr:lysylphosphatidylglycerol synthase transmembrane domain-containing protein [Chloroflexota bacterium]
MEKGFNKWKKVLKWLPGVLISILAILAVLLIIKPEELKNAFATVRIQFILIILLLDVLGLVVRGKAWQTILGNKISLKQAFFGIGEGYFLNNILPFKAGELGRSFILGRSSKLGTMYIFSTVVVERAFDIAFAGVLVVLSLPYITGMDWIKPIATILLVAVIAFLFIIFLLARNQEVVLSWSNRLHKPVKLANTLRPKMQNMIKGFSTLASPARFGLSLFWIAICWLVWSISYSLAVVQIIPNAPFWWGGFVSGVVALGVAIPSAPSGLGVFEATFVGAIAILGGSSGSALAYAILLHFLQFTIAAIIGIWGLIREGFSFSQIFSIFVKNGINANSEDEVMARK